MVTLNISASVSANLLDREGNVRILQACQLRLLVMPFGVLENYIQVETFKFFWLVSRHMHDHSPSCSGFEFAANGANVKR